jgi:hypothetical protein
MFVICSWGDWVEVVDRVVRATQILMADRPSLPLAMQQKAPVRLTHRGFLD